MVSAFTKQREESQQTSYDILLIEDDEDTRDTLMECIESETAFHVLSFPSGKEALEHLQEVSETSPRLFIIDFLLAEMTGLQLYDQLHTMDTFERVPVIMLSAASLVKDIQADIAARDMVFLSKPFQINDLLNHIETAINGHPQLI